jgi:6-phosphogluconolactonase
MGEIGDRFKVLSDQVALARRVAEWMTLAALAAKAPFRVSLSGGLTPKTLYRLLASDEFSSRFPWPRVFWYWGDERFVPYDHLDSNYRMVRELMLTKVAMPSENGYAIPIDASPEDAARRYERILQEAYGGTTLDTARPLFDVTLLGLGADGHTASLPVLEERQRWMAAVSHGRPGIRITMTYPVIDSSRRAAFLVTGREKAATLPAIRAGSSEAPASRVWSI